MDSKKLINLFEIKKNRSPHYLWDHFSNNLNNFSTLSLPKIYIFDIFDMVDFFQICVIFRSTEIVIVANFWLGVYT